MNKVKTILIALPLFAMTAQAFCGPLVSGGGSPFTDSGDMIRAIFQDQGIWRKVFGPVEQISMVSQFTQGTVFKVQTNEPVAIIDANGVTTGWNMETCSFLVTVKSQAATGPNGEPGGPVTETVTAVDFSACPSVKNVTNP